MVLVPPEYRKDCEADSTKYGKFLKKYHLQKRTKTSKIQYLIDEGAVKFSSMSKLEFLNSYLLNEAYTLTDFLSVKSPSLRGFLYETIWDICIKCNVVPALCNFKYLHCDGKVETLTKKTNIVRKKLRKLGVIGDIYQYFEESIVQSGNTGGISDITLEEKYPEDKKRKFILVSCKYYENEKSITKYDIAEIWFAMKSTDTLFDIVLLVANKYSLLEKIKKSHKTQTKESMSWIYDATDLAVYLQRLRTLFKTLAMLRPTVRGVHKSFFNNKNWKPIVPVEFHTHMFQNLTFGENLMPLWNSTINRVLYNAILYYILSHLGSRVAIICNDATKKELKTLMLKYFGYAYANIEFKQTIQDVSESKDVIFVFGSLQDFEKLNVSDEKLSSKRNIFVCKDVLSDLLSQAITWNMQDQLMICNGNVKECLIKFPNDVLEYGLSNMYPDIPIELPTLSSEVRHRLMDDYTSYGSFNVFTNLKYSKLYDKVTYNEYRDIIGTCDMNGVLDSEEKMQLLINILFGCKSKHAEEYLYLNRLRSIGIKGGKVIWIAPKQIKQTFEKLCRFDSYLIDVTKNFNISFVHEDKMLKTSDYANVIIVTHDDVSFETLYGYVSNCYAEMEGVTALVEFNSSRLGNFLKLFNGSWLHTFDPDIKKKNKYSRLHKIFEEIDKELTIN